MINRTVAPTLQLNPNVEIEPPEIIHLDNGIPLYYVQGSDQEVVSIDLILQAGKWFETKRGLAEATNLMVREGIETHSSKELANRIDFYGSNVRTATASDNASVSLFSLSKFLPEVLPFYKAICLAPSFPEAEWEQRKEQWKQRLLIQSDRIEQQASSFFYQEIFGKNHPYGYRITAEDLDQIKVSDLRAYHQQRYQPSQAKLFIAGKLLPGQLQLINQLFGKSDWPIARQQPILQIPAHRFAPKQSILEKADSLQGAMRIGMPCNNKKHEDHAGLYLLNMIFGGFFSSRLMDNIREEKGYTYGITSMYISLQNAGYLLITTEVGAGLWKPTLKEIKLECDRLKNELVPANELTMVRNYTLGSLLSSINGAFNKVSILKGLYLYGLETADLHDFVDKIKSISPEHLQSLAQKYLNVDQMAQVIAGN